MLIGIWLTLAVAQLRVVSEVELCYHSFYTFRHLVMANPSEAATVYCDAGGVRTRGLVACRMDYRVRMDSHEVDVCSSAEPQRHRAPRYHLLKATPIISLHGIRWRLQPVTTVLFR